MARPYTAQRARARAFSIGCGLLVVSIGAAIEGHGASFGSLFAVLALCFGAVAVTLTLTFRPSWVRPPAQLLTIVTIGERKPELPRNGEAPSSATTFIRGDYSADCVQRGSRE